MFLPKYIDVEVAELIPVLQSMLRIHSMINTGNALQLHIYMLDFLNRLQKQLQHSLKVTPSMKLNHQIKEYLSVNYKIPVKAQDLEEALHFHIDYLTRCLKKHTGLTPLQYLNYLRVEDAKSLLIHTDSKISVIAAQVGIENDNYFIRLFKKHTGYSPGEFRKGRQGSV
ncbi:helix-turn-helix transcriptional regulator [Paenibacillus swuensis]|uniref:helix-turn-helix transcriptional regulator n=1 Tax=Paenibacillus swuensis TaxID=1178515 RepID=UPI000A8294A5|nr:AraC family transcriptional regulator [Paenibacillus swuensis]